MREIEPQPIGSDQRTFLRHVIAKHLTQGLMQEMGGGMISPDIATAVVVNLEAERVTHFHYVIFDLNVVHKEITSLFVRG